MTACACGSSKDYQDCCSPIITGAERAPTAEALMRARYTAYTQKDIGFIMRSTHPDGRDDSDEAAMQAWAEAADWQGLEILQTAAGQADDKKGLVEFIAHYNVAGVAHHHHEVSGFIQTDDGWLFRDGEVRHSGPSEKPKPIVNELKLGRNDPCHCGSGKKFKKCHGA